MIRSSVLASALALLAVSASAQEGNGNPFPFRTPGMTTIVGSRVADTGSAAYPDVRGLPGSAAFAFGGLVAGLANEAPVQTANSEPVGFTEGTAAYASVPARSPALPQGAVAARN